MKLHSADDLTKSKSTRDKLSEEVKHEANIPIVSENPGAQVLPLSEHSAAVKGLLQTAKRLLYCSAEEKEAAKNIVQAKEAYG